MGRSRHQISLFDQDMTSDDTTRKVRDNFLGAWMLFLDVKAFINAQDDYVDWRSIPRVKEMGKEKLWTCGLEAFLWCILTVASHSQSDMSCVITQIQEHINPTVRLQWLL